MVSNAVAWQGGVDRVGCHSHQSVFVVSLSFSLSGSPFCCLPVHSVVSISLLLSPCSFCCLPVHSIVSLFILLSPCPFCCLPVHFAVSLSILLSRCSFCYLAVHYIVSLSMLYPFPICCLTEKRLRREVEVAPKLSIFGVWSSQASYFTVDITDTCSTRYV